MAESVQCIILILIFARGGEIDYRRFTIIPASRGKSVNQSGKPFDLAQGRLRLFNLSRRLTLINTDFGSPRRSRRVAKI
jgi:hypothetical protein